MTDSDMESPFHSFCSLIQSLDQNEDSIILDRNLKYLAYDINEVIEGDENILWSALQYFNERALEDEDFAVNFAMLFTSCHFDGLREHLQSSDGNSIFRAHILNMLQQNYSGAEKLKLRNMNHFYNSITLLGEFYNRLHQKSHPILIIGKSLIELLTKELKNECTKCTQDPTHVFNVNFARLLLTQVTLNGALAKPHHSNEIDLLFYELRRCMIEVPNLASKTKAFLLMSFDLYYSGFKHLGTQLEQFYCKFLDEHDTENRNRNPSAASRKDTKIYEPANSYSLRHLRSDFAGLKTNGGNGHRQDGGNRQDHRRINREYLNRPLKANDRLKYFQNSNTELARDDTTKSTLRNQLRASSSDMCLSQQINSMNNNQSERNDTSSLPSMSTTKTMTQPMSMTMTTSARPALLTISTNCQDTLTPPQPSSSSGTTPTKAETSIASPTESFDSLIHPKLENFNWFEAVEREELPEFTPNLKNNSGNKFDTSSLASYNSNPASPPERISPQSSHTNRSRRNSLNRFRSEFYQQSNEDLHQNEKRSNRHDTKQSQNYQQSWRAGGGRNSPRNGYNERTTGNDYDRENSNHNGRHKNDNGGNGDNGGGRNYNNRNLIRGGSVDSKGKEFNNQRTRHDSFNFQSYNRKTYSRNKDNSYNRTLPPRLQQKWQQQQQRTTSDYNNDCDNPKRFNNRNNQSNAGNTNKAVSGRTDS